MRVVSLLLVIASCAEPPDHEFVDAARVCAEPAPPYDLDVIRTAVISQPHGEQAFEPGRVLLTARHRPPGVGCRPMDIELQCEVYRDGNMLGIQTRTTWSDESRLFCGLEGWSAFGMCLTPELPAGDYVLAYADARVPITIPSVSPAPCVEPEGRMQ